MDLIPLPAPLDPDPHAILVEVGEANAYPCRRCLRDARPGERVLLRAYDPFLGASPYAGCGPVYVHEGPCAYDGTPFPEQLRRRLLSVRGYDERHLLVDADVVDGADLPAAAAALFADPAVAYLHVHNARPGCFAVRVNRS